MEKEIIFWMAQNRENAENVGLKIRMKNVNEDSICVKVGGYMIMVSILFVSEDSNCDGSFVAISLEDEHDDILMVALEALNDKLQRLRIEPNCLSNVLDNILEVFKELGCSKPNRLTEERIEESYVYRSAEDFTVDCETVLSMVDRSSIVSGILPWCSVTLIPGLEVVEVRMDIKHIMPADNVATALQFSFDDPLVFHLSFGSNTWVKKEAATDDFFRSAEVSVKESPVQIQKLNASMENALNGMDERFKNAIKETWYSRMCPYGPYVLLPDIIEGFLEHCYIRPDGRLGVRQKVAFSCNIFVTLLIFVGSWLKTLRALCAICKRPLPPFSRLWCCDAELCLYKFEELGFGASVLQELKNTELIDLELAFASAATRCSTRDVFEPYPSFLLKRREVRKRAGFFNKDISGIKSRKYISIKAENDMINKNLCLLQKLIDSFPPASKIQQYSSEIELVVNLGISWLQRDYTDTVNLIDLSQEDYTEKIWLPYKILRYVLFTNRLSLCLVPEDHRFNVPGSLYQLAVFFNSESELKFAERRKTEGSVFAFHGSSLSNWYSIIRNGLKCLSRTKYMSAGMAYGEGIYLSTEMDHSLRYCNSLVWKRTEYCAIALCEIFSGQKYIVPHKSDYLVVPPKNENDIVIRYLIVFDTNNKIASADIRDMKIATIGHILSGDIDLYEHYKKLRFKYGEEIMDGGLAGELLRVARCF